MKKIKVVAATLVAGLSYAGFAQATSTLDQGIVSNAASAAIGAIGAYDFSANGTMHITTSDGETLTATNNNGVITVARANGSIFTIEINGTTATITSNGRVMTTSLNSNLSGGSN